MAAKSDARLYEPSPRIGHLSFSVGNSVYVCFGATGDDSSDAISELSRQVEVYSCPLKTWTQKKTTGTPPPGLSGGACVSINRKLYTYGGDDLHGSKCTGTLSQLDTSTMEWKLLTSDIGPMKKQGAGMVAVNEDTLGLFGGYGIPTSPTQPGATFVKDSDETDGSGWTNEFHIFNISNGTWSSSPMTGSRPPPCNHFTFTTVDGNRAVVFGGYQPGRGCINDVYIIDFNDMSWTKIEPRVGESWPVGRQGHAACCLGHGGEHPQLLISGGEDNDEQVLKDSWVFDLASRKWKKLTLPDDVQTTRCLHSITASTLGPGLVEVIMFGGCDFNNETVISATTILRFKFTREWDLVGVVTNRQRAVEVEFGYTPSPATFISTEFGHTQTTGTIVSIKEEVGSADSASLRQTIRLLQQRVERAESATRDAERRAKRAESATREAERRAKRAESATREAETTVHTLLQRVEDTRKEAQTERQQAETTIHDLRQSLEDAEQRRVEIEERANTRVREAEQRAHELEQRIRDITRQQATAGDELAPYRLTFQDPLPANRQVGSGCYGTVYAVEIDGVQCIAKRVQDILLGERGQEDVGGDQRRAMEEKFRRECILLSKIRHPNIVQFMGVRYGRDMYDLTLVMERLPMDLQKCLERCHVDKFFIPLSIRFSILVDVTYGLLHLHNRSILHRDLTAGNILLTSNLRAKIADLGVSRIVESRHSQKLSTLPGTIAYMPPEALQDEPEYNLKLDVFSFGVLALFVALQQFPNFSWNYVPDAVVTKGEAELYKRRKWISTIGERHFLYPLIHQCLQDNSTARPSTMELNAMMKELSGQFPRRLQDIGAMLTQLNKLGMSDVITSS